MGSSGDGTVGCGRGSFLGASGNPFTFPWGDHTLELKLDSSFGALRIAADVVGAGAWAVDIYLYASSTLG